MTVNKKVQIGPISVFAFDSMQDIIKTLMNNLEANGSSVAIAINPEKIMLARENPEVETTINQSDVRYADGIGVSKLMEIRLKRSIPRLPGCELWLELMNYAKRNDVPVFLVGADPVTLENTLAKLDTDLSLIPCGASDGFFSDEDALINKIKSSGARIVTVAMGSPRQEQFIFKCKSAGVKSVFLGVGGTYDVYTGKVKRAPDFFCNIGLEWFYRLCSQPSRVIRQLRLVKFVFLVLIRKI
jgi:UDP-N-acetyl-D-mannosaminouronate:lipid I N-acetyl-D-mannosaminouronosyltransferase